MKRWLGLAVVGFALVASDALADAQRVDASVACPETLPEHSAAPTFPESAWKFSVQGRARVVLTVRADGSVAHAHIARSEPERQFDREVLVAAMAWRFAPAGSDIHCWRDIRFQLDGDRSPPPLNYFEEDELLAELAGDRTQLANLYSSQRARCARTGIATDPRDVDSAKFPSTLPDDAQVALLALRNVSRCALQSPEALTIPGALDDAQALWGRGLGQSRQEAWLLEVWRSSRNGVATDPLALARARTFLLGWFDVQVSEQAYKKGPPKLALDSDAIRAIDNAMSRHLAGETTIALEILEKGERKARRAGRAGLAFMRSTLLQTLGRHAESTALLRSVAADPKEGGISRWHASLQLLRASADAGALDAWQEDFARLLESSLLPPSLQKL